MYYQALNTTKFLIKIIYVWYMFFVLLLQFYHVHQFLIFAQHEASSPTLQVGLSGLSFQRGDLDAALITQIIAEKQKEVQARLVQNMLLSNIKVDNSLRGCGIPFYVTMYLCFYLQNCEIFIFKF